MNQSTTQTRLPKVLFLVTGFPPEVSGVSLFNLERCFRLARRGKVSAVVLAPDCQNGCQAYFEALGEPIPENLTIETYPSHPWLPYPPVQVPSLASFFTINAKIAAHRPDIITVTDVERLFLFSTWRMPGTSYARKHGIPLIAEYHTDMYGMSDNYQALQGIRFLDKSLRLTSVLYKPYNVILCSTESAAKTCHDQGFRNVRVIPFLSIDVSSFSPEHRDRQYLERWLSPWSETTPSSFM